MSGWTSPNQIQLFQGGEAYYSNALQAIRMAEKEILLEVFIWKSDQTGTEFANQLTEAAQRGVSVKILLDGFGSFEFSDKFLDSLQLAGAKVVFFKPLSKILSLRIRSLARLHRKTITIDQKIAYVGGINIADDQRQDLEGERSRFDFAVKVEGPLVLDIAQIFSLTFSLATQDWKTYLELQGRRLLQKKLFPKPPRAAYVLQNVFPNPKRIDRFYSKAIKAAEREIIIANAYFFPSYGFLRRLKRAAKRGVRVQIILQGKIEYRWLSWATESLYAYLLKAGVKVYEYRSRLLHAKVAVIDENWSTVGSCNLDPLSLFFNLEGNVVAEDVELSHNLRTELLLAIEKDCVLVDTSFLSRRSLAKHALSFVAYLLLRWLPSLSRLIR